MTAKALLVIDMQRDLCENLRRRRQVRTALKPLLRTIELFVATGYPVFYICFSLQKDDGQFRRFGDVYCIEGTPGAEIIPELIPLKGIVIKKHKHSAFFQTDLEEHLQKWGVNEIYLSGLQTQICIMTTAADADFRGYRAIVIEECVVSTKAKSKREALKWIDKYVGEVRTLAQIEEDFANDPV